VPLRLTPASEESDREHTECERASCKSHWLPSREPFDICDELTRITLTEIPTEVLNLLSTTIGILRQHRLSAFFPKVLSRLPERLGDTGDRLDDVLLAHVQSRRNLFRSVFHHRSTLACICASIGCTIALI